MAPTRVKISRPALVLSADALDSSKGRSARGPVTPPSTNDSSLVARLCTAACKSCGSRASSPSRPRSPAARGGPILAEILILIALVLFNGVLAGAEMAVVALRKTRVEQLLQEGSRRAKAVKRLQADQETFLATVQIGITVIGAAAGAFGGARFARDLAPTFARVPAIAHHADDLALLLVVSLLSYLSIVLGELVPKSLGLRYSERYALFIAPPLLLLSRLARPFVWLLTESSNLLLRAFGDRTHFGEGRVSAEEIQTLVGEASKGGGVDPAIGEIASRAIDFADLTAYHVMVPRERVVALSRAASPAEIRRVLLEQGHTRMPVYEDRLENVIGYVTLRDLLAISWEKDLIVLEDAIRPPLFAPAEQRAVDLLSELRRRRIQLAIVVDESGIMIGIVTLEDLLEELVGEIMDEHVHEPATTLVPLPDGSFLAPATLPVRDANRHLTLALPDAPGRATLAGLCIHLSGRIPEQGARLTHSDGTLLEVLESTPRRVIRVRIQPPSQGSRPPDTSGG